jgi:hypothetical protein
LLYSRLLVCKEEGQRLADRKHVDLLANPVAVDLGLEDPNGPSTVLASMKVNGGEHINVVYLYLLDACEKVFAGDMDQATFEEHTRWFFGTKAGNFLNGILKVSDPDLFYTGVSPIHPGQANHSTRETGWLFPGNGV